ncbi:D-amino acid aminotransferase [Bordetella bronchiseptica]
MPAPILSKELPMIPGMPGDSQVYLNGEFTRLDEAKISVLDRGFIFGDGIYEVVPVYDGKVFRMTEHLNRLDRSLAALRIAAPMDRAGWESVIAGLIARSAQPTCIIYLQVTRGVCKRDHAFPTEPITPTVFGMAAAFSPPGAAQRTQGLSAIAIDDERWLHCEIKSVSLLGNVLAKQQAVDAGVDEVVQFRDGWLTEGSSTNIWVVSGGKLLAPPKNNLILEGIRYGLMGELAEAAGLPFEARRISREEVLAADELMLTSATKEVLPIVRLDGKAVGTGKPGPVYEQLRAGYDARIAAL